MLPQGEQRQGVDRHFRHLKTHQVYAVEYKADDVTSRQAAPVSRRSVGNSEKAGQTFTSQADMLLYYVPGRQMVYVVKFTALRARLPFWIQAYEERAVPNNGYHKRGVLVPLEELEQCAELVMACDG